MTGTRLVPLARAEDAARFGGKAAGLARLMRITDATAAGVVLPAFALDRHLRRCGLPAVPAIQRTLAAGGIAAEASVRERLRQTSIDAPLRCELIAVLHDTGGAIAVRSSAIGEDGHAASFAGVFDTRLDIATIEALEAAIKEVWASLFDTRALAYARDRGAAATGMAVVLQKQIDARISGVLFTRDPLDARSDALLVEACRGAGERLVSGAVSPSRFALSRTDAAVNRLEPGEEDVSLDRGHARTLAHLGVSLEEHFGGPQDIEWCIDARNRLVILQARAITSLADGGPRVAWSNANIAENFPAPVAPFLRSFVARGYAAYFRGLGEAFGIARSRITAMSTPLEHLVGVQGGRLYYNLTNIHSVLALAPAGALLTRYFNQFTGAEGIYGLTPPRSNAMARAAELVHIAMRVPWHYLTMGRRIRRFERRIDAYALASRPLALHDRDTAQLAALLESFLDIRLRRWTDAALADTAAMICYGVLKALLRRWLPDRDQVTLENDLLKGLPGLASARPVQALWSLSRQLRDDQALAVAFASTDIAVIDAALCAPGAAAFRRELDEYFERWGFRYSAELMLTEPTPSEDPRPTFALLRSFMMHDGPGPDATSRLQALERERLTREVAAALAPAAPARWIAGASRARLFRITLGWTQTAIRLRERARMKQALLYTRLRHVALALGDRLVARGLLERRDDAFLLDIDEAITLGRGGAAPADLAGTLARRRRALEEARRYEPPDRLSLAPGQAWSPGAAAPEHARPASVGDVDLSGVAACGGIAYGSASVVLDVASAGRVRPGDVLVTRQTDPGWAAVFFLIRGLVVERGGMLSHGAIIAREYGIPAVVGVREATRRIADGASVEVNGDLGSVRIHGV